MALLENRARYASLQQRAVQVAGGARETKPVSDLSLKLLIARAMLNIGTPPWSQARIGHLLYGGTDHTTGGPKLTNFLKGAAMGPVQTAMLAQFMNYHLDMPEEMAGWPAEDAVAEVAGWIETNGGFSFGVAAADLAGDPLAFCRKLVEGLKESGAGGVSPDANRTIHDRLVEQLFTPVRHASRTARLATRDGRRPRALDRPRARFGRAQDPGTDPAKWIPTEISDPEMVLDYSLGAYAGQDLRCRLVTVRDPSWVSINGLRATDQWIWTRSWDDIIRWLPSFSVTAGAEIAAPLQLDNTPTIDLPGLYRVFLFSEPAGGPPHLESILWPGGGPAPSIPDEDAYARLCGAITDGTLAPSVTIHTGAYLIPVREDGSRMSA